MSSSGRFIFHSIIEFAMAPILLKLFKKKIINSSLASIKSDYSCCFTSKFCVGLDLTPFLPPIAAKLMIFFRAASSKVNEVRDFFSILLNKWRSRLLKYAEKPSVFGPSLLTLSPLSYDDEPDDSWPFKRFTSKPFPFVWSFILSCSSHPLFRLYNFFTRFLIDLRCWPNRFRKSANVVEASSLPFCCCSFFQRVISTSVSMLIFEKYRHSGPFVDSSGIFIYIHKKEEEKNAH